MQVQRQRRHGTCFAGGEGMTKHVTLISIAMVLAGAWAVAAPHTSEPIASLWEEPANLASRNLFTGPWSADHAPDPNATFRLTALKSHGINPGLVVVDPAGREWHVKQHANNTAGDEGPVEVVLSRVLSALGYHQPPVYYLSTFTLSASDGTRTMPGGRFRLQEPSLTEMGPWSWQENAFVGTRPYGGLLVILLLFNSTDLKDANNTLYRASRPGAPSNWFVVRDLGAALGETGRFAPRGNDPTLFEASQFIVGMKDGFIEFDNRSSYQTLFRQRITPQDVAWATRWLGRVSTRQWRDAFRAGGYEPEVAERFIRKIQVNISTARALVPSDGDSNAAPHRVP
jgi:hypothetical protein